MNIRTILTFLLIVSLAAVGSPGVQDNLDLEEMSLEELLQIQVTTASKTSQSVLETPVAITVIKRSDIEHYQAHTVTELLRSAVGIELRMFDNGDYNVGIRGNLDAPENSILVLIDGKNIFQNFFGLVLWDALPITIEEIERIEIIRGPASSLYGANAFNGVINIITREIQDEILVHVSGGEQGDLYNSFILARDNDGFAYRLGLNYRSIDSFSENRDYNAAEARRGNFKLSWDVGDEGAFSLFGGYAQYDGHLQLGNAAYVTYDDSEYSHFAAGYQAPDLSLMVYWNSTRIDGAVTIETSPGPNLANLKEDVYTLEYQQSWAKEFGKSSNRITWGLNYQYNELSANLIDRDRSQEIPSLFFQNEYRPNENWILMIGMRYDDHPVTDDHFSPRGSVTYLHNKRHAFRISYGEAFKNPTIVETYFNYVFGIDLNYDGIPDLPGGMFGNEELESEEIKNLEVGYRGTLTENLTLGLSYFSFEQSNIILYSSWVDLVNPFQYNTFWNSEEDRESSGIEMELDSRFSDNFGLRFNYCWLDDPADINVFEQVANLELNIKPFKGMNLNIRANYNDGRQYPEMTELEADELLLLGATASYTLEALHNTWTFYVTGFNLTDENEVDIAGGTSYVPLQRIVYGGIKVMF